MNHQRKPRLGLVRPLPLPLDQILKPPDAFLRNGPIVRRSAAARNGSNAEDKGALPLKLWSKSDVGLC